MCKKVCGFTIIELLVTIGISVILAAISIPNIMKWYKKDEFLRQTQEVMDTLYDARAAALSEKKCTNSDYSETWLWDINNSAKEVRLVCKDSNNNYHFIKSFVLDDNVNLSNIEYKNNSGTWTAIDTNTKNGIEFISSTDGNSKGWVSVSGLPSSFSVREIKFTFEFPDDTSIKRTICFDRIAGFPSISSTSNCND
jgi:prepilin-type N-terminal cleavage/methylation domain-containing protein